MRVSRLFRQAPEKAAAAKLYRTAVAQARQPPFYLACGVPDTVDGRFDMIALHAFLLLRRLRREPATTAELAQALFDHMFTDMDQNLREMGVGDLAVGGRVKGMVRNFYGRLAAYEAALVGDDAGLAAALRRNLFRKTAPADHQVAAIVGYVRREAAALDIVKVDRLMAGEVSFGEPPDLATGGKKASPA